MLKNATNYHCCGCWWRGVHGSEVGFGYKMYINSSGKVFDMTITIISENPCRTHPMYHLFAFRCSSWQQSPLHHSASPSPFHFQIISTRRSNSTHQLQSPLPRKHPQQRQIIQSPIHSSCFRIAASPCPRTQLWSHLFKISQRMIWLILNWEVLLPPLPTSLTLLSVNALSKSNNLPFPTSLQTLAKNPPFLHPKSLKILRKMTGSTIPTSGSG